MQSQRYAVSARHSQRLSAELPVSENQSNTVTEFRSILDETKNDQLIEEKDRAARAKKKNNIWTRIKG